MLFISVMESWRGEGEGEGEGERERERERERGEGRGGGGRPYKGKLWSHYHRHDCIGAEEEC